MKQTQFELSDLSDKSCRTEAVREPELVVGQTPIRGCPSDNNNSAINPRRKKRRVSPTTLDPRRHAVWQPLADSEMEAVKLMEAERE